MNGAWFANTAAVASTASFDRTYVRYTTPTVRQNPSYAELHCHTNFSFLDGASHADELVETAARLGYSALAVTDHDGFYGAVKVMLAARSVGLPVVYGTEIGIQSATAGLDALDDPLAEAEAWDVSQAGSWDNRVDGGRWRRGRNKRTHGTKPVDLPPTDHLVLLAGSPEAYSLLSGLVTRGQFRGEKDRAVHRWGDLELLASHPDIVALTGCWQGAVPRAAASGDLAATMREASRLREMFGRRLHIELWHHGMPEDDPRNDLLWEVAQRLQIPVVATNQVHYPDRGDADLAEVLAAIGGRRDLQAALGFWPATDERYLKAPEEMARRFARYPGAVLRSVVLAERLAFDLELVAPALPPTSPCPGISGTRWTICVRSPSRLPVTSTPAPARVVSSRPPDTGSNTSWTSSTGSGSPATSSWSGTSSTSPAPRTSTARSAGSGADSAVCRCIGLTRVDPIRLGLPFERFLSEERGRPPDIDVDLEADRREEVIQYCYRRYGRERAAMVANVITYRARSVLQDVGKTFGFTQAQVDGLSKYLDSCDTGQAPAGGAAAARTHRRSHLRHLSPPRRLPPPPRHPLGRHGDRRPAAAPGGPGGVGADGRPLGAAVGQGRLCRHRHRQVRPARPGHAQRPPPGGRSHRRHPRRQDRPVDHPPGAGDLPGSSPPPTRWGCSRWSHGRRWPPCPA